MSLLAVFWARIKADRTERSEFRRWKQTVRSVGGRDVSRAAHKRYLVYRFSPHKIPFGSEEGAIQRWIAHETWQRELPTVDVAEIAATQKQAARHLPDEPPDAAGTDTAFVEKLRSLQFGAVSTRGSARRAEPGKKNMFGEVID